MTGLSESFWSSLTEESGNSMPISLEEEFLLVEKSNHKWDGMLEFIQQQPIQGTTEVCESADNQSLIRFPSQSIWDKSRVILTTDSITNFINASYITLPKVDRRYILTESPLLNTMTNFWLMIWQNQINSIIMMNIFNEKTDSPTNQIHAYMPIGGENGDTDSKEFGDYVITYDSRESYPSFDVTLLLVTEQSSGLSRNITHYAFHSWTMDTENPTHSSRCEDMLGFIFQLYSRGLFIKSDHSVPSPPVLVHCSDGLGRSGALILLEYCLQILMRNHSLKDVKVMLFIRLC
ncbi:hypothetical protein LOD99_2840 [Oopsacas minuta]|uniref:protein-tyrosine-phosphatase n=1 Tax=Oopsacas minuta TaxID=111878 RepID=A0AAV7K169_9METZ|nr:hypothetical protein LOD99_2840 [Oopsacas minuta]